MVVLGDALCRRLYRSHWLPVRLAGAFLIGLIVSSWLTYISARIFSHYSRPLLIGNLLFFAIAIGVIRWLWKRDPNEALPTESIRVSKWDLATIGFFLVLA